MFGILKFQTFSSAHALISTAFSLPGLIETNLGRKLYSVKCDTFTDKFLQSTGHFLARSENWGKVEPIRQLVLYSDGSTFLDRCRQDSSH